MRQPIVSYTHIRDYAERMTWIDPKTGAKRTGYDPPQDARDVQHLPFHVKFLSQEGIPHEGDCICIKVNTACHTRLLKFVQSNEIRQVTDALIVEIDGTRFVAH